MAPAVLALLVVAAGPDPVPAAAPEVGLVVAPAPAELTPDKRYQRGKSLFDQVDCTGAVETLAPLAVPGHLKDEQQQIDVHRMLGICYADSDKPIEAAREFSSLLSIDPDFALPRFETPPAALEIFTSQQEAMRQQLDVLRRARERAKQATLEASGGVLLERTTLVRELPFVASFMPFGLAQAANGETVKGVIIGSVQGVALATSVTTFWISMAFLIPPTPGAKPLTADDAATKNAEYQTLLYTEAISALAFGAAYGYGLTDALWNREDRAVVEKKESRRPLTPEEIQALQKVEPRPAGG